MSRPIRLAARALILHQDPILQQDRLLLVNAYPGGQSDMPSDLWCAPGGGADAHQSLPDNLIREVYEETGLTVAVGAPALINEFHDPGRDFHQVDVYFRCRIVKGQLDDTWRDPMGVVTDRRFFTRTEIELGQIRHKPDSLSRVAWGDGLHYDPLEPLVR